MPACPSKSSGSYLPTLRQGRCNGHLPNKFEEQGELVVYGYADEVLLMAEATAPQALAAGDTLHFGAEVSWLVCRELCIPGGASLTLALPVAAVGKPSAQQAQFDRYAAQVPGALDERVAVELAVRGEGDCGG